MNEESDISKKSHNVNEFWGNYRKSVIEAGVEADQVEWYVKWAVSFAKSMRVPLKARSSDDVEGFLNSLAEKTNIGDWQIEQAEKAIGILYLNFLNLDIGYCFKQIAGRDKNKLPTEKEEKKVRFRDEVRSPGEIESAYSDIFGNLRSEFRIRHYSFRTEQSYTMWARRFLTFHGKEPVDGLGADEIRGYLDYLAQERNIGASSQNQALNAIVFLFTNVLKKEPGEFDDFIRAKRPRRLPTVLTRNETERLFEHLGGISLLMAGLLYGAGLRLLECTRLRGAGHRFRDGAERPHHHAAPKI